jgi:hypothetical protein
MNSMRMPVLFAAIMGGLGIPVAIYYLLWSPLTDLQQREEAMSVSLQKEMKENAEHLKFRKQILKSHPRLEDWKLLSWPEPKSKPADRHTNDLQAEFRNTLEDIVDAAGLEDWGVDLSKSSTAQTSGSGRTGGKKALWQSATYRVTGKGSLAEIAGAIKEIYQIPTLHRVASLTIKRDDNDKKNLSKDNLDLSLTVDALSVAGAEKRDALLPQLKSPKYPLISPNRQPEKVLASANPFVLPAPPAPVKLPAPPTPPAVAKEEKPKEDKEEYLAGVRFTSLSSYERGSKIGWLAHFYDQNNNGDKKIYSLGLRRGIEIADMYGNEVLTGELVWANERMVVLLIDGDYYRFKVGEDMYPDSDRMLSPEEYKQLGLKPPSKPEPKKPTDESDGM